MASPILGHIAYIQGNCLEGAHMKQKKSFYFASFQLRNGHPVVHFCTNVLRPGHFSQVKNAHNLGRKQCSAEQADDKQNEVIKLKYRLEWRIFMTS